ncbi:acetyltransferase family protein [Neoasaia chiangmaiensis NBRC 101099]|uniref:Acetyltransferase n=1 Tax=Neoasaia chiangmaiensis TaxID=320497 RepID=A0A1U9KSE1_9PROT|nr:GNAT family N-acetyltransferase [Neoasaia chiangmaiensis]AQS88570.1 acetyltransferase [Neoasaia chiangmaiensis]GBR36261.1 acetyltransferase family protein [Neoasaia chiangmaiensis NBRC 101099]GEN15412.1 acetyltransferase [Neoasaia chiangmaiensis]
MTRSHRRATRADVPAIRALMAAAIDRLQRPFLDDATIAASHAVMGLDTTLIDDGTYYVIEIDGHMAGCGGWSRRATLFGGNHTSGRSDALLDPAIDPARFRAMYTHPSFIRRGVGSEILALSEEAARAEDFRRGTLASTLAGAPLYRACGWREVETFLAPSGDGPDIPLIRMEKQL